MGYIGKKKPVFPAPFVFLASMTCLVLLVGCSVNEKESIKECISEAVDAARAATSAEDASPNLLPGDSTNTYPRHPVSIFAISTDMAKILVKWRRYKLNETKSGASSVTGLRLLQEGSALRAP